MLDGMRVIDAATNIAGPYAASALADLGADVIKLEPLRGDPMRAYPPAAGTTTSQFAAVNHRKRYLAIDLRSAAGRAVLGRLLADADALIQNVRPGHEAALGLAADDVHRASPRVVHATVAAFHPADGDRPGYDLLVQAESGLMEMTGDADRPPVRIGASAIDYATATWVALGIVAALHGPRERPALRVSMLDVALGLLNEKVSALTVDGQVPRRRGSGTSTTTPHGAFATADDPIVVGAATDAAFASLASVLGPPLAGDARMATQAGRLAHRDELEAAVADALATRGAGDWLRALADAGVPVARIATVPAALERHRAASATGVLAVAGAPGLGVLAPPIAVAGRDRSPLPEPGGTGRDGDAILAEHGFAPREVARLRADGVIG